MNFVLQPWQLVLAILAGWSNRQQHEVVEYLSTENQVLKEKLGKCRSLLTSEAIRRGMHVLRPRSASSGCRVDSGASRFGPRIDSPPRASQIRPRLKDKLVRRRLGALLDAPSSLWVPKTSSAGRIDAKRAGERISLSNAPRRHPEAVWTERRTCGAGSLPPMSPREYD
jgi:hypothetical protein